MAINPYVPAAAVGNGSQVDFTFSFPYISQTHIKVFLNGVETTAFTFLSPNVLRFTTAPAAGIAVLITRETPGDTLSSVVQPGGPLPVDGLNNNFYQSLFYNQETQYFAANQSTAGLQAQITTATNTANSANATALAASNAVAAANVFVTVANIAALPASPTVGQRVEILDSTGIESLASVVGEPLGFVGSSNLTVKVYRTTTAWQWIAFEAVDPDKRFFYSKSVFEFAGVVGDGSNDDTAGLQAALDWAQAGNADQGPNRKLHAPAGYRFRITAPLLILKPCIVHILSFITYNASTGQAAVIVGGNPALNPGRNKGYDIHLVGLRHASDGSAGGGWGHPSYPFPNVEAPTGVNGIEFRSAQMSLFRVDEIQAFKGAGVYFNCGGAASDVGFNAHFQQNTVLLGEIGYCSFGIRARSKDADLAAAQANEVVVKSINGNFKNIKLDESGGTYFNSGSNIFRVHALEWAQPGGLEMEIFSAYNEMNFGFFNGLIKLNDQSGVGSGGFSAAFNSITTANSIREPVTTGTITSATTSTFTVSGAGWTTNQWQRGFVYFPSIDATVRVLSNTATVVTFASIITGGNLAAAPAAGAQYQFLSDGVSVVDITNSGSKNKVTTAPPSPLMFPTTKTLTANTIYRNETCRLLSVAFTANLPNNSSCELRCGPASTGLPTATKGSNSGVTGTIEAPMYVVVPHNHYYQIAVTGSATFTTARLQDL